MKRKLLLLMTVLAVALIAAPATATTFTFTGFNAAGDPISAMATFTTGASTVTVDIWNTQVNPVSVGTDISDLCFVLSTGQHTGGTIGSFTGTQRTINGSDGTYSDVTVTTSHWELLNNVSIGAGSTGFELNTLYGGSQADTIIGASNGSNLYTGSGLASFNSGDHRPELFGTASTPVEFVLCISGVTADSIVTFADFSFGTSGTDDHPGSQVPIPPTALLVGTGLVGLGLIGWRKKGANLRGRDGNQVGGYA